MSSGGQDQQVWNGRYKEADFHNQGPCMLLQSQSTRILHTMGLFRASGRASTPWCGKLGIAVITKILCGWHAFKFAA